MHPWSIPHCIRSIFSTADCRYVGVMKALRARLGVARMLLANADSDSRTAVSSVQAKATLDLLERHKDDLNEIEDKANLMEIVLQSGFEPTDTTALNNALASSCFKLCRDRRKQQDYSAMYDFFSAADWKVLSNPAVNQNTKIATAAARGIALLPMPDRAHLQGLGEYDHGPRGAGVLRDDVAGRQAQTLGVLEGRIPAIWEASRQADPVVAEVAGCAVGLAAWVVCPGLCRWRSSRLQDAELDRGGQQNRQELRVQKRAARFGLHGLNLELGARRRVESSRHCLRHDAGDAADGAATKPDDELHDGWRPFYTCLEQRSRDDGPPDALRCRTSHAAPWRICF